MALFKAFNLPNSDVNCRRWIKFVTFTNNYKIQFVIAIFGFSIQKYIQMSTNMPSIGAVVLETAMLVWGNEFQISTFEYNIKYYISASLLRDQEREVVDIFLRFLSIC